MYPTSTAPPVGGGPTGGKDNVASLHPARYLWYFVMFDFLDYMIFALWSGSYLLYMQNDLKCTISHLVTE